jgi:hypothetical protein
MCKGCAWEVGAEPEMKIYRRKNAAPAPKIGAAGTAQEPEIFEPSSCLTASINSGGLNGLVR